MSTNILRIRYLLVLLFLVFGASNIQAADANEDYTGLGVGVHSCELVIDRIEKNKLENVYKTWIAGYLTGINSLLSGQVDLLDGQEMNGLFSTLTGYCKENQEDKLADAAAYLLNSLLKEKAKTNQKN